MDIFAVLYAYLLIKFATVFSGVEASDMFLVCVRLGCFGTGKMNCTLVLSGLMRVFFFVAPSFKQAQRKKEKNIYKYALIEIFYEAIPYYQREKYMKNFTN